MSSAAAPSGEAPKTNRRSNTASQKPGDTVAACEKSGNVLDFFKIVLKILIFF